MSVLEQVKNRLQPRRARKCPVATGAVRRVAIVGSPNVGKSVLFNALTGACVTVSNYPGTTVEVSRGGMRLGGEALQVIDTPGMYSLAPVTEEERVGRTLLLRGNPEVVLQVVDAKNLGRMLPFTLQLLETGLPLILVVNIMDEAQRLGMKIDCARLEKELGIAVVPTVSVTGEGLDILKKRLAEVLANPPRPKDAREAAGAVIPFLKSPPRLLLAAEKIASLLQGDYGISHRALAYLLLNEDAELLALAAVLEEKNYQEIQRLVRETREGSAHPPGYLMWLARQAAANRLMEIAATPPSRTAGRAAQVLSNWMMRPLTGFPILFIVLYVGLYLFVGKFGAGVLVGWLENGLFNKYIDPWLTHFVERILPYPALQDFFVHDYGLFTLGLKYAAAIILPIVATFFLVFAIFEDSGYLPRLALLLDSLFKKIGLSGRAVIPMVLGFGCDTMATLVTRVLETRRERIIATLLLALAIPCSAQLGVILALLSGVPYGLIIWAIVVGGIFLLVGWLASRILKGTQASFYIEVPPLRWPKPSSILKKTYARMEWYFREILPLFLIASVLIWIGRHLVVFGNSLFDWLLVAMRPFVAALGLPQEAAVPFLFGFFRRDYGAAGLYDLHARGLLQGVPLVVSMVTLTLFLPCIAQLLIMGRERGWKTTLAIVAFIVPFSWLVGFGLYHLLTFLKVSL